MNTSEAIHAAAQGSAVCAGLPEPESAREAGDPVASYVTAFQRGRGCPIFILGGMDGSTEGYADLAALIASRRPGQDHPIYGLGMSSRPGAIPRVTVESLAALHVAEIEKIVPRGGKVLLTGHSFGGTVAFEIARQLRRRGTLEPLPVVIDMSAINAPGRPPRTRVRQALDLLRNLPPWLLYELANFNLRGFLTRLQGHASRSVRVLLRRPDASELDTRIFLGRAQVPAELASLLKSMFTVMRSYQSKPYPGRVVLLRARVPILSRGRDPYMGWTTVAAGGVDRRLIPGKHGDCVSGRYAPELAETIAHYAAEFAQGAAGGAASRTRSSE